MSEGALQSQFHILDGTQLSAIDLTLTHSDTVLTGSQLLDVAHSRASASLFGLALPPHVTANALTRLRATNVDVDVDAFCSAQFALENASHILRDYIAAIAHELKGLILLLC